MLRRTIFTIVGLLEIAIAVVLGVLGGQLPHRDEIERGFQGAERVTEHSGAQVRILRRQVSDLRRPELQQLATRIQKQTRSVASTLHKQHVNFDAVVTMRDALAEVADGLDAFALTLDAARFQKLGKGLGETASFLDDQVVPGASRAAESLEASARLLRTDAERLNALVKTAPLDLKAAKEIHDSLAHFGEGLDRMNALLKIQRMDAMKDGFKGLEGSLSLGADQVEKLAGYTYPVVTLNGFKPPEVELKKFWPEGEKIAEGMRKGAEGIVAANKELEALNKDLPRLRESLDASRKMVHKTREALGTALAQQNKVEPLLKDMPAHTAKLAEELPRITGDLARVLRETSRLKDVAASLRQGQQGLDAALARWPELQSALQRSAKLLRSTRGQLTHAVEHREEYDKAMRQSVVLAESFAGLLPLLTDQLDNRLDEEEHALQELESSLTEVQSVLPAYSRTTVHVVEAGRWLAWLFALVVCLHGVYLLLSVRLGRRFSF